MGGKTLAPGERLGGGPKRPEGALRDALNRCSLHEVQHRQTGGETRRSGRRQHMVGSGDIVPESLWGKAAEEKRSGMADLIADQIGVLDGDLDMLGSDAVDDHPQPSAPFQRTQPSP